MENFGILAAIGAAICWGTYMVPFKKSRSSDLIQFQVLVGTGIGLSGLIFSIILGYPLNLNWYGLLSGFLWSSANSFSLIAIVNIGISRAIPLVSSLVIISSFLLGVLIFHEQMNVITGLAAVGLIVVGVILVSSTGNANSQNMKKGLLASIASGLIFSFQLVPLKVGNVSTKDFFFPVCLGIFLTGLLILVILKAKFKTNAAKFGILSGAIWNGGNLLSLISLSLIGLAKMGPLSQIATLVAVLWGLFYFKEITQHRHRMQVLIGAIILLGGVITLGFA